MADSLLILARAVQLGAGMLLAGVVAFRWLILLPAFAGADDAAWLALGPLFRRLGALFVASGVALLLSGLALFWAVAAEMSGASLAESLDPGTLATVLFQTQFGMLSQGRLGLAVLLAALMVPLVRGRWLARRRCSTLEIAAGIVAAALMVSFAGTGHAGASGARGFAAHLAVDALHLAVTAIWPAGLLPFALFLASARQEMSASAPVLRVVRRFSAISLAVVLLLTASGVVNAWFMLGHVSALFTTAYGELLGVKLLLFAAILGIAACNRYRLVPAVLEHAEKFPGAEAGALLRLQRLVVAEFVLALVIILVVGVLGMTSPPPS
ncbi:MAG: CopD family protein [Verrucomicrobiota bacterium]